MAFVWGSRLGNTILWLLRESKRKIEPSDIESIRNFKRVAGSNRDKAYAYNSSDDDDILDDADIGNLDYFYFVLIPLAQKYRQVKLHLTSVTK